METSSDLTGAEPLNLQVNTQSVMAGVFSKNDFNFLIQKALRKSYLNKNF